ncbi:MAG: hypothetical protein HY650_16890 [Acidobacteria bacterium]|nr:hypothetical protein [Acidobacteriota bacterium]
MLRTRMKRIIFAVLIVFAGNGLERGLLLCARASCYSPELTGCCCSAASPNETPPQSMGFVTSQRAASPEAFRGMARNCCTTSPIPTREASGALVSLSSTSPETGQRGGSSPSLIACLSPNFVQPRFMPPERGAGRDQSDIYLRVLSFRI